MVYFLKIQLLIISDDEKLACKTIIRYVKKYPAFHAAYRMLRSGLKQKILYLADSNILVDQSTQQNFATLEKVIHKINVVKDDKNNIISREEYFSRHQKLIGDDDEISIGSSAAEYLTNVSSVGNRKIVSNAL